MVSRPREKIFSCLSRLEVRAACSGRCVVSSACQGADRPCGGALNGLLRRPVTWRTVVRWALSVVRTMLSTMDRRERLEAEYRAADGVLLRLVACEVRRAAAASPEYDLPAGARPVIARATS